MSGQWAGDRQRPNSWKKLRAQVLHRDAYTCQMCGAPASDVDHVNGQAAGDEEWNLRALCTTCHRRKSSQEGTAARWRFKDRREGEKHPGIVD